MKQKATDLRRIAYARWPIDRTTCSMRIELPFATDSEANLREHFRVREKRKHAQFAAVIERLPRARMSLPARVTYTREWTHPRKPLDAGAVSISFKHIEDEVCRWLGCNDRGGDGTYTPRYEQRQSSRNAVVIEIESTGAG